MLTELCRCFFLGRESAGFSPRLGELTAALAWSCGMETPSLLDYWYRSPLWSWLTSLCAFNHRDVIYFSKLSANGGGGEGHRHDTMQCNCAK